MNRALRALKYTAIAFTGLLALLVALLLAAWGAANTDSGRSWLAARLAEALSGEDSDADIEGLAGPLPQRIALDRVVLRDRDGAWLTLRSVELAWRPSALLRGRLEVVRARAQAVTLSRLPHGETDTDARSSGPFELPRPPLPVRLGSLRVDRLELGSAVMGQRAVFAVEGQAAAPVRGHLSSRLNVRRLDGPGGILDIEAAYEPADRHLSLDGRLKGEAGGILAGTLALPPGQGIEATLSGSGSLDAWTGRGDLRLGRDARVTMDLGITDGEVLHLDGRADVQALMPAGVASLPGGAATFDVRARRTGATGLRLERGRLASPTMSIEATGEVDGDAGTLVLDAGFELRDPAPFAALAGVSGLSGVHGEIRLEGPVQAPEIQADVAADQLTLPDMSAANVTAAMTFAPAGTISRGRLTARIASAGVTTALPELAGFGGRPLSADLEGDLDLDAMTLSAATLSVDGPDIAARLDGGAELTAGRADGAFDLRLSDLARLDPLLGLGLNGRARLDGHIALGEEIRATILGDLQGVGWKEPFLNALAGGDVALASELTVAPDGALTLARTSIDSATARASGRLAFPAGFERIDGAFDLALDDAGVLDDAVGVRLDGAGEGTARLSGPIGDPALEGTLTVTDAAVEGVALARTRLRISARNLTSGVAGTLEMAADGTPLGRAQARSDFALGERAFRLMSIGAEAPGVELSDGRLSVPLAGGALTGEAALVVHDLSALGGTLDLPLAGRGRVDVSLSAGQEGQGLRLDGRLTQIAYGGGDPAFKARVVSFDADVDDAFLGPKGSLRLRAEGAGAGPAELRTLTFEAAGDPTQAETRLQAAGDVFGPFDLAAAGTLSRRDAATTFELKDFDADVQTRRIRLARPATFRMAPDELAIRDLALSAAGGTLQLDATRADGRVQATAKVDELPLALSRLLLARPEFEGTVSGRASLSGPAARPEGDLDLELKALRIAGADLPPLDATLTGRLREAALSASGEITGVSPTPVRLSANVPVDLSLSPFAAGLREAEPLRAEVSWQGEVAALMPWIPVSGHRLAGDGEVNLRLDGRLDDLEPRGHLSLRDATYENFDTGTLLTDLQVRINGDGRGLRIANFTAGDGEGGRIALDGRLRMDRGAGYRLNVDATASDAVLVRRDEITARADANLSLAGPLQDLLLGGEITVVRAEARLPGQLPPEVASLDVVEVGGDGIAGAPQGADAQAGPEGSSPLGLDVRVVVPNRFFLRGRGLDSEWSGELAVTGTADAPIIDGQLESVRGQIDFLGKVFTIERGIVGFDGGREIDPDLQVAAVHTGSDVTVTARLEGTVQQPSLSLSSTPPLPQDEVLARLMFGKSVTQLSALEAGQLGAAVAELSVGGGGPGLIDRLRNLVGVDVLRFGTSTDGAPSVTAGQYLTEDVFVGVEQGATPGSSAATVELGLSDNISVESQVGATGRSDVGIQFKWDY